MLYLLIPPGCTDVVVRFLSFFFLFFFFRVERGDRLWSLGMMGDPLVTPGGAVGQEEDAMGPVCLYVEIGLTETR
jgi:hypothetical protein